MVGTTLIRISKENHKRFLEIQKSRPQDSNNAQTFDYILRVFEESPVRIEIVKELTRPRTIIAGNAASPLMDLDNIRIVTPARLAEELLDEKKRRDALRAANEAPTKNNTYQEEKDGN